MTRSAFFNKAREFFRGELDQTQVDGINAIIDAFIKRGDGDKRKLAYILATAEHETGDTFDYAKVENLNYTTVKRLRQVWPSRFKSDEAARPYIRNPELLAEKVYGGRADLGNTQPGDGWLFRGRSYPQLTGRGRYAAFGLESQPDAILDAAVAATVLVVGLIYGTFTGKKLTEFIDDTKVDFRGARATINADVRLNGGAIAAEATRWLEAVELLDEPLTEAQPVTEAVEEEVEAPKYKLPWRLIVLGALVLWGLYAFVIKPLIANFGGIPLY